MKTCLRHGDVQRVVKLHTMSWLVLVVSLVLPWPEPQLSAQAQEGAPVRVPPGTKLRATLDGKTAEASVQADTVPKIAGIVVMEDQFTNEAGRSGAPSAMAYPFSADPELKKRGSQKRTLFIWGENLPGQDNKAEFKAISPHLSYERKAGDIANLLRQGWEKAKLTDGDVDQKNQAALIVEVTLEEKILPGIQELAVNGSPGTWTLAFNNQTATLAFVRERDDARQFPAHVFYTNDTAYVDLVYDFDMPFSHIAEAETDVDAESEQDREFEEDPSVEIELFRRSANGTESIGVVKALHAKNPTKPIRATFRAGPIQLYYIDGPKPPPVHLDDVAGPEPTPLERVVWVGVRKGDRLAATLYDKSQGTSQPPVALAEIQARPSDLGPLWQHALEEAAKCYEKTDKVIGNAYAREEATRVDPTLLTAWEAKARTIPLPANPFVGITVERDGISIGPTIQSEDNDIVLRKGDHAAAILIADQYLKMSLALRRDYEALLQSHERLQQFRADASRLKDPSQHPFWGTINTFYPGSSEVRIPLWQTLDAEKRPQDFKKNTPQEAEDWAKRVTADSLNELMTRMKFAEEKTRNAVKECTLEELLVLAGQEARPVVARIVPRLVKQEQMGRPPRDQWVPDNFARAFVENLAITGAAVRALREYEKIDDSYKAMAVALVTAGLAFAVEAAGSATAAGYLLAAGDAVDIAVFGTKSVELYQQGERRYEYALGASPVLGEGFLAEAKAARENGLLTAVGLIAPGISGALGLKTLKDLHAIQRGRALFREHSLDDLDTLPAAKRLDLAAYYFDLSQRASKGGVNTLNEADRAAYAKFQGYVAQSGSDRNTALLSAGERPIPESASNRNTVMPAAGERPILAQGGEGGGKPPTDLNNPGGAGGEATSGPPSNPTGTGTNASIPPAKSIDPSAGEPVLEPPSAKAETEPVSSETVPESIAAKPTSNIASSMDEPGDMVLPLPNEKSLETLERAFKVRDKMGNEITDFDRVQRGSDPFGTSDEWHVWVVEEKSASNVGKSKKAIDAWVEENIVGKLDKYEKALQQERSRLPKDIGDPAKVRIGIDFKGDPLDEDLDIAVQEAILQWKSRHTHRIVRLGRPLN